MCVAFHKVLSVILMFSMRTHFHKISSQKSCKIANLNFLITSPIFSQRVCRLNLLTCQCNEEEEEEEDDDDETKERVCGLKLVTHQSCSQPRPGQP